jgi:drug/metabolite transporter (DMT)-like permease
MLLLGLGAALAAAGFYSAGVSLQALEARRAPARHFLRLSLLRRLATRRLWLAGIALDGSGWALQTVALGLAPLTLVQPVVALGLVFLLGIGVFVLRERLGRMELLGVVAIAGGIAGLGVTAPAHHAHHAGGARLAVVLAVLGALALVPYLLAPLRRSGTAVALAAGLAFSWDGLATKFAADEFTAGRWGLFLAWLVGMIAAAGVGTLAESSAFQRRPATQVAPLVFGVNTLVPVLLAPLLADERWSGDVATRAGIIASLAAVLAGIAIVARSAAVGAVLRAEASS